MNNSVVTVLFIIFFVYFIMVGIYVTFFYKNVSEFDQVMFEQHKKLYCKTMDFCIDYVHEWIRFRDCVNTKEGTVENCK